MGEYNGGARKRVPSLTERMVRIRDEQTTHLTFAILHCPIVFVDGEAHVDAEEANRIARDWIRNAVAATELAVNEDNRTREARTAQAKQDAKIKMFHRPGRFGHG
jgi:hypothetical protein